MEINQSISFIESKGSALEQARLACILGRSNTPPAAVLEFLALQNEDGGFPYGMKSGNLSTLNETTVALWWLEELDLLASPAAEKASTYLLATQRQDGSWEEDARVVRYDLPPWIQLGDLDTRLYLSAYASYWLAVGGRSTLPAFRKAIHFLLRHQESSGRFHGYLHTTWIAAGVLLMAGERYAAISNRAIQALSARAWSEWADSQLAWALDCLSRGGLPAGHPFVQACLEELISRQAADGSWSSEDGEAFAVSATLQALKVLVRYNLIR